MGMEFELLSPLMSIRVLCNITLYSHPHQYWVQIKQKKENLDKSTMDMELNHHLKITVSNKAFGGQGLSSPLFGWASFWFCPHVFLISPASDSIFPRSLIQFPADSTRPPLPSCMGRFRRCRRARRLPSTLEVRTVWPNYLHSGESWELEHVMRFLIYSRVCSFSPNLYFFFDISSTYYAAKSHFVWCNSIK